MSIQLTPEQSQALTAQLPTQAISPEGAVFYLLSADQFGKVRAFLDGDDADVRSFYPQIAKVFGPAGWDDPEMDIYNDLDPRQNP